MGYYLGKGGEGRIQPSATIPLSKALAGSQLVPGVGTTSGSGTSMLMGAPGDRGGRVDRDDPRVPLTPEERQARRITRPPKPPGESTTITPIGGEWQWPEEMRDLFGLLYGRAGDLLMKEPGFSQNVLDEMFGRNFEKVRGQEAGARDVLLKDLAAQGMLGTGTETEAMKDLAWGTEANVGDIMSNVFLANEAQKRQDLSQFTQLASQLFGQSMDYQTTQEALSAGRRNEANQMLAMLLSLYGAGQGSGGG